MIYLVAAPTTWGRWQVVEAMLEPARARGDFANVIEPDEELFVAIEHGEILGAATAWFSVDTKTVEVKFVGGRDRKRWLAQMNEAIGAAARQAGAVRMVAFGRCGWKRELAHLGWDSSGAKDVIYTRRLEG